MLRSYWCLFILFRVEPGILLVTLNVLLFLLFLTVVACWFITKLHNCLNNMLHLISFEARNINSWQYSILKNSKRNEYECYVWSRIRLEIRDSHSLLMCCCTCLRHAYLTLFCNNSMSQMYNTCHTVLWCVTLMLFALVTCCISTNHSHSSKCLVLNNGCSSFTTQPCIQLKTVLLFCHF